jgi:hypothetical protein
MGRPREKTNLRLDNESSTASNRQNPTQSSEQLLDPLVEGRARQLSP